MILRLNRRELANYFSTFNVDALKTDNTLSLMPITPSLSQGDVMLEFQEETGQALPTRIIVRDADREDFFAWASTYVDSLSPLTAFIEVWTESETQIQRRIRNLNKRAESAIAGAVLIDALLQSKSQARVPDTILPAAQRTLSAVFAQTIFVAAPDPEVSDSASLWSTVREALGSSELAVSIPQIVDFWAAARAPFSETSRLRHSAFGESLRYYLDDDSKKNPWRITPYSAIAPFEPDDILQLPREERLRFVDHHLSRLRTTKSHEDVVPAIAGYLLSLVSDGDFSFWPTAVSSAPTPVAALWFGFFSGGNVRSNVFSFSQGIGRRLIRILRSESTNVDIDAREFLISRRLRTRSQSQLDFPISQQNALKARLAPGVNGTFSIRDTIVRTNDNAPRTALIGERDLREARYLVERLSHIINASAVDRNAPQTQEIKLNPKTKSTVKKRRKG